MSAVLRFDQGTLTLAGVTAEQVRRGFLQGPSQVPWVADTRSQQWRTDAMYYRTVTSTLVSLDIPFRDEANRLTAFTFPKRNLHPLRSEQEGAVNAWLQKSGGGCIVMPTGTGKTEVALSIMAATGVSTLVVSPVRDLMYQWHRRILEKLGVDAGIIGDSLFQVSPVSVTTYDSACIHMQQLGDRFQLLVFDECHHLPGPMRRDAARMSISGMRLGLTATLERADGGHRDLEYLIGPVVYELSVAAAKGKSLADYEVVRIPIHLNPEERARYDSLAQFVRDFMVERLRTDRNFTWEQVCSQSNLDSACRAAFHAMMAKKAIEDRAAEKIRVLEDLFRLHAGEPVIVFTGSNAMAYDVSTRFLVPCILSHCGKRERLDILQGLEHGDYPAIVANRVLDEGVDLPEVKVAVVIGGLSSGRQAKQRLGRILRRRGNQRAVLYEIVTEATSEVDRSRKRRRSDAYQRTRHRPL